MGVEQKAHRIPTTLLDDRIAEREASQDASKETGVVGGPR
jgi:hypothetical protein